jgi:hypothetical protein
VEIEVELDANEREDADDQYAANHVKPDNVLFRDLNSTETVHVIFHHAMDVVNTSIAAGPALNTAQDGSLQDALFATSVTIQEGCLMDADFNKISPIQQHTGAILIGDGSPSYSVLRGIDQGTIPPSTILQGASTCTLRCERCGAGCSGIRT